jgi:CSLREA domain-containing protein
MNLNNRTLRHLLLAALLLCLAAGQPARASVQATTIGVTTTADELNNDGDCSLREALQAANLNTAVDACPAGSGPDIIIIPNGVYALTLAPPGEDANQGGDLDVLEDVTIIGASKAQTILDGNNTDRIFHLVASAARIAGLTIRNGFIPSGAQSGGGGIRNDGDSNLVLSNATLSDNQSYKTGGGLDNAGTAQVNNVLFSGNSGNQGGALLNTGSLLMSNTTLSNNSSTVTGGGLDNNTNATLNNVTFSGNTSPGGGGMFNDGADVYLINVTFANNGTAIQNAGTIRVLNTIIAYSTEGNNCLGTGTYFSLGHNLDSGATCNLDTPTDLQNTNPLLDSLGDNQGPTPTHALLDGSPAIDAGDNLDCSATDQRGAYRPADGNEDTIKTCDIGAFEFNGVFPILTFMPLIAR